MNEQMIEPQAGKSENKLNLTNVLFFTLTPLAGFIGAPLYFYLNGFSWGPLILLAVTFAISNMSITVGYHRYFSHRSYDAHPVLEWLLIFFGSGAFQGSVLQWCEDHRRHHRHVDTDSDPYSINKGFWYAHLGWIFYAGDPGPLRMRCPDLEKKKFIMFQHKHYALIATFVGFILPGLVTLALGMGFFSGVIFGGALRITLSTQSTFLINSACHYFGRQPYTDKNTARDSFIMAVLTFGEGYHNYHHMFQADYRNGIRWYHWDPTKWSIQFFNFIGLASRLKKVSREEILKARLVMEEKLLLAKGARQESVLQLKKRVEDAQIRMRNLKTEYIKMKISLRRAIHERSDAKVQVKVMKAEAKIARLEFKAARAQWTTYVRAYRRA